jgi:hypothetical protein
MKCPLLLSDFNQNWNLHINFSMTSRCQFYGTLFSGYRTDMEKLIVTFLQISLTNARKIIIKSETCGVQIFSNRYRPLQEAVQSH